MVKNEDVPRFLEQIYFESKRMTALVEDIIRLSRLDEGGDGMRSEEVDFYGMAVDTLKSLESAAAASDISLHLEGGPAVLWGIPVLLEGILFNLCDNAIKYNKKGGRYL